MGFSLPKNSRDLSLVICGSAGHGLESFETLLSRLGLSSDYHVCSTKEYMSRVRGGSNSIEIRFSPTGVSAPVDRIDLLVPLSLESIERIKDRITKDTLIIGESGFVTGEIMAKCGQFIEIPFMEKAREIGHVIYANQVALGTVASFLAIDTALVEKSLRDFFKNKEKEIVEKNIEAARIGFGLGAGLTSTSGEGHIDPQIE
ncbi:MAG: 2-oxoacid:acceptor oxidoreductase family protein, partial [Thermodesulfobacteriota bacterium]